MYGVTLAFSLFLVWEAFSTAQRTTESEAGNLERIYHVAYRLPESQRDRVQELVESYARLVVEEEWPVMGQGRSSQGIPQAETLAEELQGSVEEFEPGTSREQSLHSQLLILVDDLQDDREERLLGSRQGIPSILWVVLIIGGAITVSFTFLFGIESPWLHKLTTAALAVVVVLILYSAYRIQYPFAGDVRVEPVAFEQVLSEIEKGQSNR